MPRSRPPSPPRDQATSTFTRILERLLGATPGARGAALVDYEGETVDYAGHFDPFDLKVTAAHWQIALREMAEAAQVGALQQIIVRARRQGYFVRRLQENYAVVLIVHPRAAFAVSERAVAEAIRGLSREAGWSEPAGARWWWVEVETERRGRARRPNRIKVDGLWQPVEVMGALIGLAPRERGFRVRLASGHEMMLVRERLGRWFADEHVE
jgi:predicted regulator of Ras-like GTPase activity (Roadblock/LC7/MglB family)